jgi:hypothetical protein
MNCFRHPDAIAGVYCKECYKPICPDCAQQTIQGQKRVCSEVCAHLASLRQPEEKEDSPGNRLYASVFIVLLLAMLGGIFVLASGQLALIRQKRMERRMEHGEYVRRRDRPGGMIVLYYLGITDWRKQFAIGAAIGAGSGWFYVRRKVSGRQNRDEHTG